MSATSVLKQAVCTERSGNLPLAMDVRFDSNAHATEAVRKPKGETEDGGRTVVRATSGSRIHGWACIRLKRPA